MGSFRPGAGNQHLHWYFNFTGCVVETVPKSLRLSCGSELTRLSVSHRPVFLLNSCLGHFSAATLMALLLPKLRSHFAEFLNNTSPVGLRILSSSTCVGLRYGHI